MLALPQTVTDEIAGFVVKLPLQGHLFSQQTLKWSHKCHPLNQLAYPKKKKNLCMTILQFYQCIQNICHLSDKNESRL